MLIGQRYTFMSIMSMSFVGWRTIGWRVVVVVVVVVRIDGVVDIA